MNYFAGNAEYQINPIIENDRLPLNYASFRP